MPRRKQNKTFLHLYIDKNVLAKAKELIPNLLEFVETKLREYIILAEHGLVQSEWARRDSNPRPPPRECEISEELISEYLEYRRSRLKSERSMYWIEKVMREFLKFSKGEISREIIMRFQNWYKSHYDYEAQRKFHTNVGNFLEWLRKITGDDSFLELKELLEPPKRDSKKLNPIILREDDVKNVIRRIWVSNYDSFNKLRLITAVLFASYTGQRPQATIAKITFLELEEALNRSPPLLWIPEDKDKERFPHWVPIHPVLSEWLEAYISTAKDLNAKAFPYDPIRKALSDLNVKAIHTGRKIAFSHFRKFFEQMCNNVLGVHLGLRDYIMAHNTGSLDVQSYDGKLPSEIYEQYMLAWKNVNLVPEEVKLEELLKKKANLKQSSKSF